jgi:hypothetical protein
MFFEILERRAIADWRVPASPSRQSPFRFSRDVGSCSFSLQLRRAGDNHNSVNSYKSCLRRQSSLARLKSLRNLSRTRKAMNRDAVARVSQEIRRQIWRNLATKLLWIIAEPLFAMIILFSAHTSDDIHLLKFSTAKPNQARSHLQLLSSKPVTPVPAIIQCQPFLAGHSRI